MSGNELSAPGDAPMSRRQFTAFSLATGLSAAAGKASAAVKDADVQVKTAAGVCDAALVQPQGSGQWPAVIMFPDAFGLRPAMRDMAKRLAADGYVVLVPNPYYRSSKPPGVPITLDFANAADRAKVEALRAPLTSEAVMQDAVAYMAYLDAQPSVNKKAKAGAVGYCMGGTMTMQAAGAVPERIGAGASFHGGNLATDKPDSPHLLVPRMKAQFYFGIAMSDDERQPDAKSKLKQAFAAAGLPAKIEVYEGTLHGWCIKDMQPQGGKPVYNEPQAERAWNELTALFKRALV
jgi:carboxymethylenebutenolidase